MPRSLIEPILLILIGLSGGAICWIYGEAELAFIGVVIAFGGAYELRETLVHEQDMKKFER